MIFYFQKVTNSTNVQRIKELEDLLVVEKQKTEHLEVDSTKLFETEEALVKLREEYEALKKDMEITQNSKSTLEAEHAKTAGKVIGVQSFTSNLKIHYHRTINVN